jgi:cytoskeletal protein RodZ
VGVVLVVLVGGFFLVRQLGGSDDVTTTPPTTPNPTTSSPAATTPSPSATTSSAPVSPTVSPSPTTKPPTLAFTVVGSSSYITVRIPGGKTLVSRLFKKGAKASFDQKTLTVVNGRPSAVRFVVNGKPRKPGPSTQTEIFTVHRA